MSKVMYTLILHTQIKITNDVYLFRFFSIVIVIMFNRVTLDK